MLTQKDMVIIFLGREIWSDPRITEELGPRHIGYPLVMKHWLENPRLEWRFLARKITQKQSIFQQAMFDYRRVAKQL